MFVNSPLRALLLGPLVLLLSCSLPSGPGSAGQEPAKVQPESGRKVQIVKSPRGYQLLRDGQPYFIRGGGGYEYFDVLKECGGNSVRVWDAKHAGQVLDEAHRFGLTVTLGLEIGKERQGFDYNDEKAVAAQLENFRKLVLRYKDHPALLMWGIGNEVGILSRNHKVWTAVNDIARMIHRVDPDHPTTTMIPPEEDDVAAVKQHCPDLDLLAINAFGTLEYLGDFLEKTGWDGPYILSEWGPWGYWQALERTNWDASVEYTSTQKAEQYKTAYLDYIKKDSLRCLGSYVFYWGFKQERTATWHCLFTEDGKRTEGVETLQALWQGAEAANRSPRIASLTLQDKIAGEDILLDPAAVVRAKVSAHDPDQDSLEIRWSVFPDPGAAELKLGGDVEARPQELHGLAEKVNGNEFTFKVPNRQGAYRVFVYIYDKHNHAATANIPFYAL